MGGVSSSVEYTEGSSQTVLNGPVVLTQTPSNTLQSLRSDAAGNLNVNTPDIEVTGTLTIVGSSVQIDCSSYSTAGVQLTGTILSGNSYIVEVSVDGSNWATEFIFDQAGFSHPIFDDTGIEGLANTPYLCACSGYKYIRIKTQNIFTVGSITASIRLNHQASSIVTLSGIAFMQPGGAWTSDGVGNANVSIANGFKLPTYDYVALTQTTTTDTYTFKSGFSGAGGSTVAILVITYTDATKATIANVNRTL